MKTGAHLSFGNKLSLAGSNKSNFSNSISAKAVLIFVSKLGLTGGTRLTVFLRKFFLAAFS